MDYRVSFMLILPYILVVNIVHGSVVLDTAQCTTSNKPTIAKFIIRTTSETSPTTFLVRNPDVDTILDASPDSSGEIRTNKDYPEYINRVRLETITAGILYEFTLSGLSSKDSGMYTFEVKFGFDVEPEHTDVFLGLFTAAELKPTLLPSVTDVDEPNLYDVGSVMTLITGRQLKADITTHILGNKTVCPKSTFCNIRLPDSLPNGQQLTLSYELHYLEQCHHAKDSIVVSMRTEARTSPAPEKDESTNPTSSNTDLYIALGVLAFALIAVSVLLALVCIKGKDWIPCRTKEHTEDRPQSRNSCHSNQSDDPEPSTSSRQGLWRQQIVNELREAPNKKSQSSQDVHTPLLDDPADTAEKTPQKQTDKPLAGTGKPKAGSRLSAQGSLFQGLPKVTDKDNGTPQFKLRQHRSSTPEKQQGVSEHGKPEQDNISNLHESERQSDMYDRGKREEHQPVTADTICSSKRPDEPNKIEQSGPGDALLSEDLSLEKPIKDKSGQQKTKPVISPKPKSRQGISPNKNNNTTFNFSNTPPEMDSGKVDRTLRKEHESVDSQTHGINSQLEPNGHSDVPLKKAPTPDDQAPVTFPLQSDSRPQVPSKPSISHQGDVTNIPERLDRDSTSNNES